MHIAILGAQGSGKTQLTQNLRKRLGTEASTLPGAPVLVTEPAALMAAVQADLRFNDVSLYAPALAQLRTFDLILLMGLDLPWTPSQQAAPSDVAREAVDTQLRKVLTQNQQAFTVIYGLGSERMLAALQAVSPQARALAQGHTQEAQSDLSRWHSSCEKCSDPVCEHRLFTGRLQIGTR